MKNQSSDLTSDSTPASNRICFQRMCNRAFWVAGVTALLSVPWLTFTASAQPAIRFTTSQVRITVPVNFTNSTVITNFVDLVDGATNANFTVSGLPAGTGVVFTDTNGNPLTSTSIGTNLWLTVNTTNIPEGLYQFSLNAGGLDNTGLPVTNSFPFILQAAHLWNGSMNASNGWSDPGSWMGGLPASADDVVLSDFGAQTNGFAGAGGIPFTNSFVTTNMTIGSLRFSQTGLSNALYSIATNPPPVYNHLHLNTNVTLTISGTNGFSIMRDYLDDLAGLNPINIFISGDVGAKMVITNLSANATLYANSLATTVSTLNMTNLNNLSVYVNRLGLMDFQLYPNYRSLNVALNAGRDTNTYSGHPSRETANVYLARTNVIVAYYADPNNYTNEYSRSYPFTLLNNEQLGISSGTPQNVYLGISNSFMLDGVCFYGANGNGFTQFAVSNSFALFRNTNGTGRMSVFTIADDGGTNEAQNNIKGNVDFSQGVVDILADRFYIARDREQIATNNGTPNVQGSLMLGKGKMNVNTAVLGFQEHQKLDVSSTFGEGPYLNYCRGTLGITNGGIMVINGTLTLGYTADINDPDDAQQFNTFGQVTVYGGSTLMVSNVICDGGLNYYDSSHRQNTISLQTGGTLVISNTIGGNNFIGSQYSSFLNQGSPCLPLDTFTMGAGSTLVLPVVPGVTNMYVRSFVSSGTTPGIIKISSLPVFPVYPTNISLIYYGTASPFVAADMSAIGGNIQGYILNNSANQTIDLFLTTNAAQTVTWTGAANNQWDLVSLNWVTTNGLQTNFALGDIAIFNDSATVTGISITDVVVPNQATNGVVISNSLNQFTFTYGGGAIAGTAKIIKTGTNILTMSVAESGPLTIVSGELDVSSGTVSSTTVASNCIVKLIGGIVSGNLSTTNTVVTVDSSSQINGSLVVAGGSLYNNGQINIPGTSLQLIVTNNAVFTNDSGGTIAINGTGNPAAQIFGGCTMANFGTITVAGGRMTVDGLYYGTGQFYDNVFPSSSSSFGRLQLDNVTTAMLSPGATPYNSITNIFVGARLDLHVSNPQNTTPKFYVEVDAGTTNCDTITCARWNNLGCIWVMTNLNATAPFTSGEIFRVLVNYNGTSLRNLVDTADLFPLMQPTVPGPGLEWNLTDVEPYGLVGITNCNMVWTGGGNGSWDTNNSAGNWKSSQLYIDGQGAVFDDSATSSTITLNTSVAPAGFNIVNITNTDHLTFTNIVQTSNAPSFSPGIVVSNALKNYTIAGPGKITGQTSIYKTGPGTLTLLSTNNDFSGGIVIEGGTVAYTNVSALGFIGNITGQRTAYNQIMIDNGTVKDFGTTNQNLGWFLTLNQDGGTFEVSSNSIVLGLNDSVVGAGALTKTGLGILTLSQAADAYAGGTVVNQGTLRLTSAALGTGSLALNNTVNLDITNNTSNVGQTITNAMVINGPATTINLLGVTTNVWSGIWTGAGFVTFNPTNAGDIFSFSGDVSGFSGTISLGTNGGTYRFGNKTNDNTCLGSAAATWDLGTGNALLQNFNGSNLVYNIGALKGGPNTVLCGRVTNSPAAGGTTYSIGSNGISTTFSGRITNGLAYNGTGPDSVSVVKVGTGALWLNGINLYTGTTTVGNGILGGTGSIASQLTVAAGGTLEPGSSVTAVGTFTVSNSVTLAGNTVMKLNQANPGQTNDLLKVTGTLTGGGALVVTNVGPNITNGSSFKLFSQAVSGFSSISLPTGGGSYVWFTNLAEDGSIKLVTGGVNPINTNPTNIVATVTNGVLTLAWPADHTGWRLQVETNPLSVGLLTNNWYTVPNSTNVDSETIPMDVNQGSIFYRLSYP